MKYQAAIFDLDGTLVDTITDIADSANQMLASYGLDTHEVAAYRYFVGNGSLRLIERIVPKERLTTEFINEALGRYKAYYQNNLLNTTKPYNGIMDMLNEFRSQNIPLAICSNKHDEATQAIVKAIFPNDMFVAVIGDKAGMPRKPDPFKLLKIAEDLKIEPHNVLYFGDSGVDMETGKRAGMVNVGVLWGFRDEQELLANGADIIITEPMEIFSCIQGRA